jgi:isoleucyl-tRNA synthetase
MANYRLYNVVPGLLQFIEDLTNTYIRFNRRHFWQEGMPEDKRLAYETLYETLVTLSKVMAPFAPFLAESTYQNLTQVIGKKCESVHLESFPEANISLEKPELEEAVRVMEALVVLGRNYREKIGVKAKIPLKTMVIIHRDEKVLNHLRKFEPYFQDELNIQTIQYDPNEDQYIQISAKANFPVLGKKLGPKMKSVAAGIQKLKLEEILQLEAGKGVLVEGEEILLADVEIRRAAKSTHPNLSSHQLVSIDVDPTVSPEQIKEGLAREVIRKIQAARKNADFILDDRIRVELHCTGAIREAVESHQEMLQKETLCIQFQWNSTPTGKHTEDADIDGEIVKIGVTALPR